MSESVRMAFDPEGRMIALDQILPSRLLPDSITETPRYMRIDRSIEHLGVIEPLIVFPQDSKAKKFVLLDGHVRLMILKARNVTEALCLISTDDETLTYNHKVNQVQAIQEHFMIVKAINAGLTEERIATTLNVDVRRIREKRNLLEGLCKEVVELLRTRNISSKAIGELKRVRPLRQIEMAELMIAGNNFSSGYAKAMVLQTKPEFRLEPSRCEDPYAPTTVQIARIEREMNSVTRDFRRMEEDHGKNVLNLVLTAGYLKSLLNNASIVKFLSQRYAEILSELQKIVDAASLEPDDQEAAPEDDDDG